MTYINNSRYELSFFINCEDKANPHILSFTNSFVCKSVKGRTFLLDKAEGRFGKIFKSNVVSTLNCLVGENGVGKSRLMRLACELLPVGSVCTGANIVILRDLRANNFLVFNNTNEICDFIFGDEPVHIEVRNTSTNFDTEESDVNTYLADHLFVYYSPITDTRLSSLTRWNGLEDISNRGCLESDNLQHRDDWLPRSLDYNQYVIEEFRRNIEFIVQAPKSVSNIYASFGVNLPEDVEIYANKNTIISFEKSKRFFGEGEQANTHLQITNFLKTLFRSPSVVDRAIASYLAALLEEFVRAPPEVLEGKDINLVANVIYEYSKFIKKKHIHRNIFKRLKMQNLPPFIKWKVDVYDQLLELLSKYDNGNGASVKIPIKSDDLSKILSLMNESKLRVEFPLCLAWNGLSTGEQAVLSLFSRFYNLAKDYSIEKNRHIKSFVIFLDEFESNMHPEWVRIGLSFILKMIEYLFADRNVKLVLATNNPIVVTDLPSESINYLGNRRIESFETFASEIGELIANDFFLEEGMGKVATDFVFNIIDEIKRGTDNKEYLIERVSWIGDSLLRERLLYELAPQSLRRNEFND